MGSTYYYEYDDLNSRYVIRRDSHALGFARTEQEAIDHVARLLRDHVEREKSGAIADARHVRNSI